jgi:tyrosyl-DNA phosphodiesterase 1
MIIGLLTDKPQSRSLVTAASSKGKGKGKAKAEPEVIDLISSEEEDNDSVTESETETDSDGLEVVDPPVGWIYVGSHNFTPSAWGTLSGSAFNPVMNVSYFFFLYRLY